MSPIHVGSVRAKAGETVTGWLDAVHHPTGGVDRFPILIAQGQEDGPVAWITTGLHGDEHTGMVLLHRLFEDLSPSDLKGTLIAITALNPGGIRIGKRESYYHNNDPNRMFPDPYPGRISKVMTHELERAYAQVHATIKQTDPAFVLDLHNAMIGSIPFVIRDPVFYHRKGLSRTQARGLQRRIGELAYAFGFTVVNEFVASSYRQRNLHRSLSGSVINGLGIPALTIELGSSRHVDQGVVEAGCSGIRNLLRQVSMIDSPMESIAGIPVLTPEYPIRRHSGPSAESAGIVDIFPRPGAFVKKGEKIAILRDIFGQALQHVRSDEDGYILGWHEGAIRYEGASIVSMAIRDEGELIGPFEA